MQTALVGAGISVMVLGVNLMLIFFTLRVTRPQEIEVIKKLRGMSFFVMALGIMILVVGIPVRLFVNSTEADIITGAGSSILVTGFYTLFRAIGHKSVDAFRTGGFIVSGVGLVFIIAGILTGFLS